MKCPKCGVENAQESVFCMNCGTKLVQDNIENVETVAANPDIASVVSPPSVSETNNVNNQLAQPNNIGISNTQTETLNTNPENKNKFKLLIFIIIGLIAAIVLVVILKSFIVKKDKGSAAKTTFADNTPIKIKKDSKYGYINTNGEIIIEPTYLYATDFYGDYAEVAMESTKNGYKTTIYGVIDTKGNVVATADLDSGIKYFSSQNIWVVDGKLYNDKMKQLSKDNVKVEYEAEGYLLWKSDDACGIMDKTGKITYTINTSSYCSLGVEDDKSSYLIDTYCFLTTEDKKRLINCDSGKVLREYSSYNIMGDRDNVFSAYDSETYKTISRFYAQGDKIVYETEDEKVRFNLNFGNMEMCKMVDGYYECQYIDYKGNLTDQQPEHSPEYTKQSKFMYDSFGEWEDYTGFTEFSCDGKYGLKKGEKIVVPCEYSNFKSLDITLYKNLESKGKEYIYVTSEGKISLMDIKANKIVAEFMTSYISYDKESPFIYYEDSTTKQYVIYNLLTGKKLSINLEDGNPYFSLKGNYMTVKYSGKVEYYNNDLKLIYTEEQNY